MVVKTKKKSILFVMLFVFSLSGFSQESNKGTVVVRKNQEVTTDVETIELEPKESNTEVMLVNPEKMPLFPGGEEKLYKYLGKSITYPDSLKYTGVQGKVYVRFFVEKDGSVSDIKVIRGLGKEFDETVMNAIRKMPKWTPAEQGGKKVRVKYTIPIMFNLR